MIHAQLFTQLELTEQDRKLSQEQIRSDMVSRLLSYLICHRNSSVTVSELIENLWPDDRRYGYLQSGRRTDYSGRG